MELPNIEPLNPRWEPNPDPASIVVPGLDTTAPVQDQIEQIEQLITIKLQNIDANFSRVQQILATKILPAVKRYAVNTEPVREAAKFWVSFYEQAAQVRIPTSEDFTPTFDGPEETEEHGDTSGGTSTTVTTETGSFDPNMTPQESSFMPGQAAVSSTPMASSLRRQQDTFDSEESSAPWAASMESPLDRLDREMQNLRAEEAATATSSFSTRNALSATPPFAQAPRQHNVHDTSPDKGKGRARAQPQNLRENVLRQNLLGVGDTTSTTTSSNRSHVSPLKVKPKTPKRNPYVAPGTPRGGWDGLVDLSKTKPSTPKRGRRGGVSEGGGWESDSDSEDDLGLPPGMSPPVTMDFNRPPRSAVRLGRTPVRAAAARIGVDLVGDAERRRRLGGDSETSQSTVPSLPSISRWDRHHSQSDSTVDVGLESMLRQVGLDVPADGGVAAGKARAPVGQDSFQDTQTSIRVPVQKVTETQAVAEVDEVLEDNPDSDSSSEEFEEGHTGAPSAAFLMASQRPLHPSDDDSFGSSNHSSDSLSGEDQEGAAPVHPFAGVFSAPQDGDGFDDSFDDDGDAGVEDGGGGEEEPTLFGVPPAQRAAIAAARANEGQLRMLGRELLDETIGIGQHLARNGAVEESPTPWAAGRPS
ncbi:hypothetical protein BD410DRAFT_902170 [Rickenella mellea]|uniref:DASH complex subunit ASK1 n=1 Tax=Rickenella mellea TaxID=50990 RepID=A0A4Y7PM32_9AGAM|nr:hypothetical protein BD410DRAFT_902170 [Rickenella mellea]